MSTIEVGKIYAVRNSVNGVKVAHEYYNSSDKEIKYITFSYAPFNSVNDLVKCTVSGKTVASGELTGPISAKHKGYIAWENMWYNPTITTAKIVKIHIQYMDGTEEEIEGKDVVSMEDKESAYYNEVGKKEAEERAKIASKQKKKSKIIGLIIGSAILLYLIFAVLMPMFMG